jgi:hypothetical protein
MDTANDNNIFCLNLAYIRVALTRASNIREVALDEVFASRTIHISTIKALDFNNIFAYEETQTLHIS